MPNSVSPLPAALDALLQALTLALPDGVQLVDGQPVKTEYPDIVMIGFNGEPGTEAITISREPADYGRHADHETYEISCLASSYRGGTDAKLVRDRAFELVSIISAELDRDQTIGETVAQSYVSIGGVAPVMATTGAVCTVRFNIHADAFLQ